jgi:hypothetical protein
MKIDWASAQHNVQSLKDLGKPVYWVPTRIGKIDHPDGHAIITKLNNMGSYIFAKDKPVILGLPASKGTKRFETEFKPLSELDTWLDNLLASDRVQRQIKFKLLGHRVRENTNRDGLRLITAYGFGDWLFRLNTFSFRLPNVIYDPIIPVNYTLVDDRLKDIRTKFPDVFSNWRSPPTDNNALQDWATQVAELTNCKPTGAKSKNV